jgi:curved DNA-binding protein CbpA
MAEDTFIDYYEILQLSPNADSETVEKVFRLLAKHYHPDNNQTGNSDRFSLLSEAYRVLSNPEKRAAYDVKYDKKRAHRWQIFEEASASEGAEADRRMQQGVISLLYIARRRDTDDPGMGIFELERLLGCPEKHLEFHMWYLKEKGWIQRTDTGGFAITASGVDAVTEKDLLLRKDRLLTAAAESQANSETSKSLKEEAKAFLAADNEEPSARKQSVQSGVQFP